MTDRSAVADAVSRVSSEWLEQQRWFGGKGRRIDRLELAEAFELAPRRVLAVVDVVFGGGARERFTVPLIATVGDGLGPAAPGDGVWAALAVAALDGRVIPAMAGDDDRVGGASPTVGAVLVCRPAISAPAVRDLGLGGPLIERSLGVDQSNTSVVLAERLVLKAFRRIEPGLEPDLEVTAFLSEEAAFGAVPALAGSIELVSAGDGIATVAMLSEFIADAEDGYETTAEQLTNWLLAPGSVTVEFATEDAADLGYLTAALHGALVSRPLVEGFQPRRATQDELRGWRTIADDGLQRAIDVAPADHRDLLRAAATEIGTRFTIHEALVEAPLLTRIHGDYHLGQVMRSTDGWRVIDFEGEPTRSLDVRRAHASPLRDVASMLRSLHHVALSAKRRAVEASGGPLASPGLDLDGWLRRSRERFLASYRAGVRRWEVDLTIDDDLLLAFELEKACYEFVYAATYLPSWADIAFGGLQGLLGWAREGTAP